MFKLDRTGWVETGVYDSLAEAVQRPIEECKAVTAALHPIGRNSQPGEQVKSNYESHNGPVNILYSALLLTLANAGRCNSFPGV